MSTDVISNLLSSIRNASMVGKDYLEVPHSNNSEAVAKVLEEAKFLSKVKVFKEKGSVGKSLRLDLIYNEDGDPAISGIRRISKPGRRLYSKSNLLRRIDSKYGVLVVSTPSGVMSGEEARKRKLGGELICEVR